MLAGKKLTDFTSMFSPYDFKKWQHQVIEAGEFRKNPGVKNDQSIRIEREMIALVTKIFAKENPVRQYQIPGLPYRIDLCFVAHKLVIEIDEDCHPYYENNEIWVLFLPISRVSPWKKILLKSTIIFDL